MVENGGESFEDLLLGGVSEQVSESDEQFQARVTAAQAKLQQVKKDEKKAQNFDVQLAGIIPHLSDDLLHFVIFMIDSGIPSLTILSFLSLVVDEAGQICYQEFHSFVEERADFSLVKFQDPQIEEKVSWWWTFILAADHVSRTTLLKDFKENQDFVSRVSRSVSQILQQFLRENQAPSFDQEKLKTLLHKYRDMVFSNDENITPS